MLIIILDFILLMGKFYDWMTWVDDGVRRVVVATVITIVWLLLYRCPLIGHALKVVASALLTFFWGFAIVEFVLGVFVQGEAMILTKGICMVLGTVFLSKCYFEETECGFFETPDFYVPMWMSLPRFNLRFFKDRKLQAQLESEREELLREKEKVMYQRECAEQMKQDAYRAQMEAEAAKRKADTDRKVWEERKAEEERSRQTRKSEVQLHFFKGCKTVDELKKRYRKLSQTFHPDADSGDEESFKEMNLEYEYMMKKLA